MEHCSPGTTELLLNKKKNQIGKIFTRRIALEVHVARKIFDTPWVRLSILFQKFRASELLKFGSGLIFVVNREVCSSQTPSFI